MHLPPRFLSLVSLLCVCVAASGQTRFSAGAAKIDISPRQLPAIRNGGFLQATWDRVEDPLHGRCLVLDDGDERLAVVIVDSCMIPTNVCDAIKNNVATRTSLRADRILISATHTHSAPSVMSYCLGSSRDEAYTDFLVPRLANLIVQATESLRPAKIGWTSIDASQHTNCRRWITRGDRMGTDPFSNVTVRAMMHPGYMNPSYVSPAGPIDPELFVVSVATDQGEPICVLANFSMHYFGSGAGFSADYFGEVAQILELTLASKKADALEPVGIMSQGTSGDLHWMDYAKPQRGVSRSDYASQIAAKVIAAQKSIQYRDDCSLAMAERRIRLNRRTPDPQRLQWAKNLNQKRGDRIPRDRPEVYAQQAQYIHDNPETTVVLQAVRIGDLGITAMPNEVYGITGLKLKKQSPLEATFNLELANGAEGYIPPPEQHRLGGYTTWPARTAGLEVNAEPVIVDNVLSLLESVAGRQRRVHEEPISPYANEILKRKPAAFWRLDDLKVPVAHDHTGVHPATYKGAVALHLPGSSKESMSAANNSSRCVYFAGGSMRATLEELAMPCTVTLCFWNGMPPGDNSYTGQLIDIASPSGSEVLSIETDSGITRLVLKSGTLSATGKTTLTPRAWQHVSMVRKAGKATVYLDGKLEIEADLPQVTAAKSELTFGSFDGKLDEIALFNHALTAEDARDLYQATGMIPPRAPETPHIYGEKPFDAAASERYADAVRQSEPLAYWRLHDDGGPVAKDLLGRFDADYEQGAGPRQPGSLERNFSGGRVIAQTNEIGPSYSVELWMRNEIPTDQRPVTGYLLTRGEANAVDAAGDSLGIGGTHTSSGRLLVYNGDRKRDLITGTTRLIPGSWHHVVLTRQDKRVRVFLDGQLEIDGLLPITFPQGCGEFQFGGRNDNFANFVGMLDEVAVYDRTLSAEEVALRYRVAAPPEIDGPQSAQQKPEEQPEPTAAEASLQQIKVREGYRVELVASEPQVKDPVAIDWSADGSLWVVEMADYPLGLDGQGKPGGRVRKLTDQDRDGFYETSVLFADGLPFPTGVLVWGDGILVTAAPQIVYLQDTNGDGKADHKQTLYEGFLEGNQQLRVNGLRWGLDNWVHCASGSHHGGYGADNQITAVATGKSHDIGSRDFRIQPDNGAIDALSGPSQFGRNRDDWGNWFGVQNSLPLWHYVLRDQDIRRNAHFAPPNPKHQVVTPTNPPVYPASKLQKRFHSFDQSGRFTSACASIIYRDELLFPRIDGTQHSFTCEPFHNLVQHNVITDDGVSFAFHRDATEGETDFFASEDRWCRPVMTRTGPEGGLWVVDMYRYMIEHPQWLPPEGKEELQPYYRLGDNHGRIYRVLPIALSAAKAAQRLASGLAGADSADPAVRSSALVNGLRSPNGWQRDFAQRELVREKTANQADSTVIASLRQMAIDDPSAVTRIQALATLDGLNGLTSPLLRKSLRDPHAGVRRHSLRLAVGFPELADAVAKRVDDPDAKVRLQVAATQGAFHTDISYRSLAQLAFHASEQPYILANVMSSLSERNVMPVLSHYTTLSTAAEQLSDSQRRLRTTLVSQAAAMVDPAKVTQLITRVSGDTDQDPAFDELADLIDAFNQRGIEMQALRPNALAQIAAMTQSARAIVRAAANDDPPSASSVASALRLLLREPSERDNDLQRVADLLAPQVAVEIQMAAADRLGEIVQENAARTLLEQWTSYTPRLRSHVLAILAGRTSWSRILLEEVKSGAIGTGEIDPSMRSRLLATQDTELRSGWETVLATSSSRDRQAVIESYQAALQLDADPKRGGQLFAKHCAACHKIGQVGHEIGPNLASITDRRPQTMLVNLLDPSAAVETRYMAYIVLTRDGRVHNGLLETETGSSISLVSNDGKRTTILRSEIEQIRSSGKSLMPDGLEKEMTSQDVADVIRWVLTVTTDQ